MLVTDTPFPQYFDLDGTPLQGGYLYFGTANQNPETNPIAIYWDQAGTQPVAQPVRTVNGYVSRFGTPATIFVGADYSLTVKNDSGSLVMYRATSAYTNLSSQVDAKFTALAASGGAATVGYIQPLTGAVATNEQERLAREVWIEDFMTPAQIADCMTGSPTLDVYTAVQAAIDAVCPYIPSSYSAGQVRTSLKAMKIGTRLNLTNSRATGTRSRDGLSIIGNNQYGTRILGETGAGNAVIETTGSQFLKLERLSICSGSSNKSTIGILQACGSVLQQTQNQRFTDVSVVMHSDSAANGGLGTIGIWNFGAEENTYCNFVSYADRGVVLTSANDGTQPGAFALTSYQTLLTTHSLGMTTFSGECALISAGNRYGPQVTVQNIGPCYFEHTYIGGSGTSGSNTEAIQFIGNAVGFSYRGVIEGMSSIRFDGSLTNCDFNIDWGGVYVTTEAALRVNRSVASGLYNCNFKINLEASTSRPILSTVDGNESATSLYSIANTTIQARANGAPNLYMPLNVAKVAGTYGNQIIGANARPSAAAFAAGLTTTATNATGDGTNYLFNTTAWTEDFDSATAFDSSTGVFTAPLSGFYEFNCHLSISGLLSGHTDLALYLVCNGQKYLLENLNPGAEKTATNQLTVGGEALVSLTAGQAVYLQLVVSNGTKVVNVLSGSAGSNWCTRFEGRLVF